MKTPKPKKTLAEEMETRMQTLAEAKQQRTDAEKRAKFLILEDQVMAETYGPNWRDRYPGETVERVPEKKAS